MLPSGFSADLHFLDVIEVNELLIDSALNKCTHIKERTTKEVDKGVETMWNCARNIGKLKLHLNCK